MGQSVARVPLDTLAREFRYRAEGDGLGLLMRDPLDGSVVVVDEVLDIEEYGSHELICMTLLEERGALDDNGKVILARLLELDMERHPVAVAACDILDRIGWPDPDAWDDEDDDARILEDYS